MRLARWRRSLSAAAVALALFGSHAAGAQIGPPANPPVAPPPGPAGPPANPPVVPPGLGQPPGAQPGGPQGAQPGRPQGAQPSGPPPSLPATPDVADITGEDIDIVGTRIHARNVTIVLGEYTLTGDTLDGDFDQELVFSGNPTLTYRGEVVTGDTIRFTPRTRGYRVENLHTALSPEFLQGRLLSPLYLAGGEILGRRNQPITGSSITLTTCERPRPDYLIRAGQVKVEPGKRVTLRRATLYLFGKRLVTLPTLIIPLDRDPHRTTIRNVPSVGRSADEGWFAKTAFNTLFAGRVPGLLRLDAMQKKGIGIGTEQAWNLAKIAGALAIYAIPTGGPNRDLSGRFNNRFRLGGGQFITTDNDFQRNSYLSLPGTTTFNNRLGYELNRGWLQSSLNVARQATDSQNYLSRSYTANLSQVLQLGRSLGINFNTDYSRYSSGGNGFAQRTEQLATRMQADQRGSNYLLQVVANKNIPIGQNSAQSFFNGLEKLPEVSLQNYRFTGGWLSTVPATFLLSAGKYSEGGTVSGSSTQVQTERVVTGIDLTNMHYALTGSTDLNVSGGFQQFFYGEGAAQYVFRNNTTFTQRWGKHSGLNLNYTYQRPEGGTPFRFDQIGQYHTLNADIGFLDDRRIQLTARVGYDFGQSGFGGLPAQPWQTLSANLLVRPFSWARVVNLFSFDPNTGKMVSVTSDLRLRGRANFAVDLVSRYDPRTHKMGSINGYLNIPLGRWWRVIGLFQYNGYMNDFESRNIQLVREFDCLEASLTYIDNPFGFRNDRQIFFQLRIKAFPVFQRFGAGQFGQAIDTSVGGVY